jgi:hypothetical protein
MYSEKIEPKFDNSECRPYGEERIPKAHRDMLEYIRTPQRATVKYRDGILTLSDISKPAYECQCGFNGLFEDTKCARCGKSLFTNGEIK